MERENKSLIKTTHLAIVINGVHTEILQQRFSNCIFMLITQTGKMGTLIEARADNRDFQGGEYTYSLRVLSGKRDDNLLSAYSRQLVELVSYSFFSGKVRPSLLLGISLAPQKDLQEEKSMFNQIIELVKKHRIW